MTTPISLPPDMRPLGSPHRAKPAEEAKPVACAWPIAEHTVLATTEPGARLKRYAAVERGVRWAAIAGAGAAVVLVALWLFFGRG